MLTRVLLYYGLLLLFAIAAVTLAWFLASAAEKTKRLEERVRSLEEKLDAFSDRASDEARKQRRLLTESVSGLTEIMTRSILTLGARSGGGEAEKLSDSAAASEGAGGSSDVPSASGDSR